ncbi:Crp/Fnr family transcriptional regulator [Flavobacterium branchiophilum]|uniref:Crp/Fnr family transcriptional regulator n=1 Tax=Flavobacterium branchiophilum TaxID=55197 RepID=A0A2H3KE96_9FLAO|nr:Crp/Fnr family transcriptional regulator [Flavobacterium branchiophilum]PDS25135.1 Crp/Fnr family transcriptional regulator [Flavobacterium branchiophilum]
MTICEQCDVRKYSSLSALTDTELAKVAICKTTYNLKKGDAIFNEGDATNGVFCVKEGACKMTKLGTNGKDHIIKIVKSGELLGQRSMISDENANLSAVALAEMKVCFIPKSEMMPFFQENQKFSMAVLKTICNDLKEADDHTISLAQKTVKQRLAETLIYLYENFGENPDGSLKIQLSREEMAGMIGTATESCIRLLSEFNKNNDIDIIGKKIIILNANKLKMLALG